MNDIYIVQYANYATVYTLETGNRSNGHTLDKSTFLNSKISCSYMERETQLRDHVFRTAPFRHHQQPSGTAASKQQL